MLVSILIKKNYIHLDNYLLIMLVMSAECKQPNVTLVTLTHATQLRDFK